MSSSVERFARTMSYGTSFGGEGARQVTIPGHLTVYGYGNRNPPPDGRSVRDRQLLHHGIQGCPWHSETSCRIADHATILPENPGLWEFRVASRSLTMGYDGCSLLRTGVVAKRLPRSEEHTSELQSLRHLVC